MLLSVPSLDGIEIKPRLEEDSLFADAIDRTMDA